MCAWKWKITLECDSHGNPMGIGIAMWLIRGMEIKQRKRFINVYTLNYRPSLPNRFMPGPLPSSADLQCGHSCRLETKAWPSQTILAQNGGDRDLRPLNLCLASAKRRTQDRAAWRRLVATATSTTCAWRKKIQLHRTAMYWGVDSQHNTLVELSRVAMWLRNSDTFMLCCVYLWAFYYANLLSICVWFYHACAVWPCV